jgi:hypothetical protein
MSDVTLAVTFGDFGQKLGLAEFPLSLVFAWWAMQDSNLQPR